MASDLEPRALSSYVSLNPQSGVVFAQRAFDHEQLRAFELTLQARDHGSPALSANARRGSQGASRAAPGKSGLHARGEAERVLALESREGTRASRRACSISSNARSCSWSKARCANTTPLCGFTPSQCLLLLLLSRFSRI